MYEGKPTALQQCIISKLTLRREAKDRPYKKGEEEVSRITKVYEWER